MCFKPHPVVESQLGGANDEIILAMSDFRQPFSKYATIKQRPSLGTLLIGVLK
jgi:hypothetical protein